MQAYMIEIVCSRMNINVNIHANYLLQSDGIIVAVNHRSTKPVFVRECQAEQLIHRKKFIFVF